MKHFIHLFLVSFLLANLCSVNAVAENTPKTATSSENTMIAATEPTRTEFTQAKKITFSDEAFSVQVGHTQDLDFELLPQEATCSGLEVTSSSPKIAIAELDAAGSPCIHITGIASGKSTITIKASNKVIAKKQISVVDVLPEQINITADSTDVYIGDKGTLSISFMPEDVTSSKVTWKSSSAKTVRVNKDGTFQALSVGEADITASHSNGVSGTIHLNVLPILAERVELTSKWDAEKPFYRNNSMQLTATVLPENTTDKTITWSSSNDSIATVSPKGLVKALSAGNVTITATTSNGIREAFSINIPVSPQKFRLSASITMVSNDHVGSHWSNGFEFNHEPIRSGSTLSLLPGEEFTVGGWAEDADSKPDYGSYSEKLTLTDEMCKKSFTVEGDVVVVENGGRYSGNCAVWHLKMTFTPIN